jgi:ribonuclease HII
VNRTPFLLRVCILSKIRGDDICSAPKTFFSVILNESVLVGIDEAGRGPVIGPLIVCGAAVSEENINHLESLHLKDSKRYTRTKREELAETIITLTECVYAEISASEIDLQRQTKTLNDIEVQLFAEVLLNVPEADRIIVDACDVNPTRFGEKICACAGVPTIVSEHRADNTYPIVSAASIMAKVRRDQCIQDLKEVYGDFGSGYSSDKKTYAFLRTYIKREGGLPPIARSSWDTAKKLLEEYYQRPLDAFL